MADKWLSIVEYARHFNISDMTVRRRIKTGRLAAELKEGKYYINIGLSSGRDTGVREQQALGGEEERGWRGEIAKKPFYAPEERQQFHKSYNPPPPLSRPHHGSSYVHTYERPQPTAPERLNPGPEAMHGVSPHHSVSVSGRELLHFCQQALQAAKEFEQLCERNKRNECLILEEKVKHYEALLREKELCMSKLQQELEDFQLLLQIMEQREGVKA